MEKIIRNVRINPGGTIYNRTRQCLAYADDVVILGRTIRIQKENTRRNGGNNPANRYSDE
jgi:hypothetical protein